MKDYHIDIIEYNKVVEALDRCFKHDLWCQQIQSIEPQHTPCDCGAHEAFVRVMKFISKYKP